MKYVGACKDEPYKIFVGRGRRSQGHKESKVIWVKGKIKQGHKSV